MSEESLVKEMSVLSLTPEDTLVIKACQNLSECQMLKLKEQVADLLRRFGWENQVLVLSNGLTIEVLRKEES